VATSAKTSNRFIQVLLTDSWNSRRARRPELYSALVRARDAS